MPDWDPDAVHKVKWWSILIPVFRWLRGAEVSTRRGREDQYPWWFLAMVVILRPFYWVADKFKRRGKK